MKKMIAILVLSSMSSIAFGANLSETERSEANEAANYGLCHELKLRPAKGDEKLLEANCGIFITAQELRIEKKALIKRLNQINADLKRLESAIGDSP